jgi:hypothetical protein
MSVGLPGSGIGGVFYLVSALWMPVHGAQRSLRGRPSKARVIARQSFLAALILLALWGTGVVIDVMIGAAASGAAMQSALGSADDSPVPHIFRAASFALTFGTLAGVLLLVQILRLLVRPRIASDEDMNDVDRKAA